MASKRLAFLIVLVAVLGSSGSAQVNEVSVTVGRTFVSTQTVPKSGDPIHFGDAPSFGLDYARTFRSRGIFGLSLELPVAIDPKMKVNYPPGLAPRDIGSVFITPSARLNIFSGQSVSPWFSAGGGYGRFWESSRLTFGAPNPKASSTNTGVVQFGAGLDVWPWAGWGARLEARDFYSGIPNYNVATGRSRQHNYYVGIGVIRRF
jgi:hypothetical protein